MFNGCKELFIYDYDVGKEYEKNQPDPPDDPTVEDHTPRSEKGWLFNGYFSDFTDTATATQDIQLDSLYDCNSFHDCVGVLG